MDNVSFNDQTVITVMEIVRISTRKIKKCFIYSERQLIKEANFALYAGYYVFLSWFFSIIIKH